MNFRHYKKNLTSRHSRAPSNQTTSAAQIPQSSSFIGFHGRGITPDKKGPPSELKKSTVEQQNKSSGTSVERKLLQRNLSIASMKTHLAVS